MSRRELRADEHPARGPQRRSRRPHASADRLTGASDDLPAPDDNSLSYFIEDTEAIHETLTPSRAGCRRGGRHSTVNQRPAGDQPRHGAAVAQHRSVSRRPRDGGRRHRRQPLVYYMGATGGGVWKTDDAGVDVAQRLGRHSSRPVRSARSPSRNRTRTSSTSGWAKACLRGNLSSGDGVYKSTDAGKTWTHVGLPDSSQIGRIRIHPTNPDVVYVAAIGHPYGPNAERGVFRTKDGGTTWQKVLFVNDRTGAADIAMDPSNPQVLYATTWQVLRTPWDITSTGPGGGLYKSTDGGDTWNRLTSGLPTSQPREDRRRPCRRSIRSASGRPSKPTRRAASIARTTAGAPGSC